MLRSLLFLACLLIAPSVLHAQCSVDQLMSLLNEIDELDRAGRWKGSIPREMGTKVSIAITRVYDAMSRGPYAVLDRLPPNEPDMLGRTSATHGHEFSDPGEARGARRGPTRNFGAVYRMKNNPDIEISVEMGVFKPDAPLNTDLTNANSKVKNRHLIYPDVTIADRGTGKVFINDATTLDTNDPSFPRRYEAGSGPDGAVGHRVKSEEYRRAVSRQFQARGIKVDVSDATQGGAYYMTTLRNNRRAINQAAVENGRRAHRDSSGASRPNTAAKAIIATLIANFAMQAILPHPAYASSGHPMDPLTDYVTAALAGDEQKAREAKKRWDDPYAAHQALDPVASVVPNQIHAASLAMKDAIDALVEDIRRGNSELVECRRQCAAAEGEVARWRNEQEAHRQRTVDALASRFDTATRELADWMARWHEAAMQETVFALAQQQRRGDWNGSRQRLEGVYQSALKYLNEQRAEGAKAIQAFRANQASVAHVRQETGRVLGHAIYNAWNGYIPHAVGTIQAGYVERHYGPKLALDREYRARLEQLMRAQPNVDPRALVDMRNAYVAREHPIDETLERAYYDLHFRFARETFQAAANIRAIQLPESHAYLTDRMTNRESPWIAGFFQSSYVYLAPMIDYALKEPRPGGGGFNDVRRAYTTKTILRSHPAWGIPSNEAAAVPLPVAKHAFAAPQDPRPLASVRDFSVLRDGVWRDLRTVRTVREGKQLVLAVGRSENNQTPQAPSGFDFEWRFDDAAPPFTRGPLLQTYTPMVAQRVESRITSSANQAPLYSSEITIVKNQPPSICAALPAEILAGEVVPLTISVTDAELDVQTLRIDMTGARAPNGAPFAQLPAAEARNRSTTKLVKWEQPGTYQLRAMASDDLDSFTMVQKVVVLPNTAPVLEPLSWISANDQLRFGVGIDMTDAEEGAEIRHEYGVEEVVRLVSDECRVVGNRKRCHAYFAVPRTGTYQVQVRVWDRAGREAVRTDRVVVSR
jgi:hypothetical protein